MLNTNLQSNNTAMLLILMLLLSLSSENTLEASEPGSIRISTINIHYTSPRQKKLNWDERKDAVTKAIKAIDADIIAFQEMETFAGGSFNKENKQLDWVLQNFPQYHAGAYGDATLYPNTQPVLYRHDRFSQLEQGFFFFSTTPDVIYSRTFNGSWPAFCSWSLLQDKDTDKSFYIYNVHFEYKSMSNRGKSAQLVKERVQPVLSQDKAVILLGDINAPSFSPTARKLKSIPLTLAKPAGSTFHFNRGLNLLPAIDHVFFSEHFTQQGKTQRLRERYDGIWPTDHYPVTVEVVFGSE